MSKNKKFKQKKQIKQIKQVEQENNESLVLENEINLKCISLVNIIRKNNQHKANKAFDDLLVIILPKVQKLISRFNIPGCDNTDILQEALFALRFKAIKDYDKDRSSGDGPAPFDKFALLCIRRHLATEFKSSYQNKKRILNQSVSLDKESKKTNSFDEDLSLSNIITNDNFLDLITEVGEKEYFNDLHSFLLESLSDFEKVVFVLYTQKYSYEEIAEKINQGRFKITVNVKGVDNALSRIKNKAKSILEKYESGELKKKN